MEVTAAAEAASRCFQTAIGGTRITDDDVATTTMGTELGQIKGTLANMSPEQAPGNPEDIDVRADVYAWIGIDRDWD